MKVKENSFISLFATNFCGVMNDNVLKILTCFVAVSWTAPELKATIVNASAAALVLPYLLFSPLASRLPGLYGKLKTLRVAKFAELFIMAIAIAGFVVQSVGLCLFSVLLMGLQSALYSPSKYALIRDIGGTEGVARGMGGMEEFSFMAMLLGTVVASFMADYDMPMLWYSVLMGLAVVGYLLSLTIKVREEPQRDDTSANPIRFIRESYQMVKSYPGLNSVINYLSLFWWLSASLQMLLIIFCEEEPLSLSHTQTGLLLALMAVCITIGCIAGGFLDGKRFLFGATPLIGILISALLVVAFVFGTKIVVLLPALVGIAFLGGVFKIPLDAYIQRTVPAEQQGTVLAYFNLISFVYIFVASMTNLCVMTYLPSRYVFLFTGVIFLVSSLVFIFSCRQVVCWIGYYFMRWHYDINVTGREMLETKRDENLLILPNHQAVIDPLMLFATFYREKFRPLVDEGYFNIPLIGHVLSLFSAIPVPDLRKSRKGVEKVMQLGSIVNAALEEGTNVLFYPSGHITTDGRESIGTRQMAYNTCKELPENTRVILVHIKGLWGSACSRKGKKATPSIILLLLSSFVQIVTCTIFLRKRRAVTISLEDVTAELRDVAQTSDRVAFNKVLEDKYNSW